MGRLVVAPLGGVWLGRLVVARAPRGGASGQLLRAEKYRRCTISLTVGRTSVVLRPLASGPALPGLGGGSPVVARPAPRGGHHVLVSLSSEQFSHREKPCSCR